MKSHLERIRELLPVLPEKDARLSLKFLMCRNFQGILELVDSDIYKASKNEDTTDDTLSSLMTFRNELTDYMSYLDIPDDSELDYY